MTGIISYNAGNTRSVSNALARLKEEHFISDSPSELDSADRLIFPGVGEASSAMQHLKRTGLEQYILQVKRPFLGICLGMQLLCQYTEEGDHSCLGLIDAQVRRFRLQMDVPHMGWNNLKQMSTSNSLLLGIVPTDDFYFVHSYYVEPSIDTIAKCKYGLDFSAAVQKDNFYGVQFHPEKSSKCGEKILENFLQI